MEATLYLPYYDYNDSAFDVTDDYYKGNDYIELMSNEFNKNKDIVYNSMLELQNGRTGAFLGSDGQTYKFGQKTSQSEDKVAYSSCECRIYNEDGKPDDVDSLITHFAKQESFVLMFELNMDSSEEEFETEMSLWATEHGKINSYKSVNGEEWAWKNEPVRNIRMCFKNKSYDDVFAELEDCKMMDVVDMNMYIIFVGKINLIDKIQ